MKSDSVKDKKFEKRKSNLLSAKVIIFKNDKSHDKSVVIPKKIEQKRKESGKISLIELKHEA